MHNMTKPTQLPFIKSVSRFAKTLKVTYLILDSLQKSPPGMDGTTYFQQSPRCVPLPPQLSSLGG